ncbi:helix-turn-helix domain-containing protein [Nonomuraea sp. NPDC050310]|uniref:PucR family transcriptional regulator n=1 Tax=unclassified Nonomuraea TaxID=2593643 RepID=UPI0033BFEC01
MNPGGITLGVLLDSLGADLLRPLALPRGREVAIGAARIHDPDESGTGLADAVLLVPGRPTAELLDWAAGHRIAAVVLRAGAGDPETLAAAAERVGVGVLQCPAEAGWGRLYTLINTLHAITGPATEPDGRYPADLFALANDLAVRAGGAVAIEDLSMRVLAYSTIPGQEVDDMRRDGILGRRVPDHPAHVEEYALVMRSEVAVWSYEPREYRPRLAIAVRDRGEALGSIWVLLGDQPLAPDAAEVLVEGARLAAPHLARANLAADHDRRLRAERLTRLLGGVGSAKELADSLGLVSDAPATVIVVGRAGDHPPGVSAESAAAYVGDLLRTGLGAYRLRAAAGARDAQAVVVVGATADAPVLEPIIATVLARARDQLGGEWRAGFSRPQADLSDVPAALEQARQALDVVCGPFGGGAIGRHERLAASLFLLDAFRAMRFRPSLEAEPLSLVLEHDARHGTDYVRTLRCWIAAGYDIPRAAEALVLHPNTLRHRLRRLAEVLDLDDPDLRLALALQLRLQEISTMSAD